MADRACASWSTPIALLWALDEPSTLSRKLVLIPRELDIARYEVAVLPC
jgi:hypothetical protein